MRVETPGEGKRVGLLLPTPLGVKLKAEAAVGKAVDDMQSGAMEDGADDDDDGDDVDDDAADEDDEDEDDENEDDADDAGDADDDNADDADDADDESEEEKDSSVEQPALKTPAKRPRDDSDLEGLESVSTVAAAQAKKQALGVVNKMFGSVRHLIELNIPPLEALRRAEEAATIMLAD